MINLCWTLWGTVELFSRAEFSTAEAMHESSISSHPYQRLLLFIVMSVGMKIYIIVALIWNSLMTNDVMHHVVHLWLLFIFFGEMSIRIFPWLLIYLFFYCWVTGLEPYQVWFASVFSLFVGYLTEKWLPNPSS